MAVAIGTTLRRMGDMAVLRWLIAGLLVGLGLWLFHHAWAGVRWHEVEAALAAMPVTRVILSFAFTLLGFAALGAYDVLALACVAPGRVPRRLAAATGMVSYAFSNALGFHVLTGGSIRYRIYARAGLELVARQ